MCNFCGREVGVWWYWLGKNGQPNYWAVCIQATQPVPGALKLCHKCKEAGKEIPEPEVSP